MNSTASKQQKLTGKTIAVIGSGLGGLSLAARLAAAGNKVTIFEKRAKIGGRAYQMKEGGYTFDMGPSVITATSVIESVFSAAGARLEDEIELTRLDPCYRIYFHDQSFIDYTADAGKMKTQMAAFNVKDAANYDRFMRDIKPIYDTVMTDGLGKRSFDKIWTTLSLIPRMIKTGAWRTAAGFAAKYFKDPRNHFTFSFHPLFIGGNPYSTPGIYLMIPYLEAKEGVWYAKGGMYSLVEALGRLVTKNGGVIRCGEGVEKILVENGRAAGVRTSKGDFRFDAVAANSDVGHTYTKLIEAQHRKKWTDKKTQSMEYTMSCFLIYLGVKKKIPNLKHHTILLAKDYKNLLKDIFSRKVLGDDFSMYLHVPSITDPSMAPEGCESLYVLVPVANQTSGIDWNARKDEFAQAVLRRLEEKGLTDLRKNIEVMKLFTPLEFETSLSSIYGNAFGLVPKISQTGYLRPHNNSEDVNGLYFVGAGTHPGAGVPGVMLGAEATINKMNEDAHLFESR